MRRKTQISNFVRRKIEYLKQTSNYDRGVLARLRKGVGKHPAEYPDAFGILLQEMPEDFLSKNGELTVEEWSCYTALTLFALNSQESDCEGNVSIGSALNQLVKTQGDEKALARAQEKYRMLAASSDMNGMAVRLRGITTLLRSNGISLNYAQLAGDLYQFWKDKKEVSLKWGQDLYKVERDSESVSNP